MMLASSDVAAFSDTYHCGFPKDTRLSPVSCVLLTPLLINMVAFRSRRAIICVELAR
jgi:hypothetical protein